MNGPLHLSPYLEQEPRPLGEVVAARAGDDFRRGLKLHECPFKTPRLSKLWERGWIEAARAHARKKEATHVA